VQSQVRFNRVPEKVAEKVPEKSVFLLFVFMHVHTAYMDVIRPAVLFRVFVTICFGHADLTCSFASMSCFGIACVLPRFVLPRVASQHASERFVKRKRCSCWGYHRSFF